MNAMRIEVGLGAAALGKRGLNESLLYASDREQGGKRIILYDDVKRMLLQQKAYAEGAFALTMHAANLHEQHGAGDHEAGLLLDSIVEVVKSWPSEWCLEANKWAIQVLGGAGYVVDYPLEQLYRDNRLNMIHEGTAGVHANTLLGRKMSSNSKSAALFARMRVSAEEAEAEAEAMPAVGERELLLELSASMREAIERAEKVTGVLTSEEAKPVALVNAHEYLNLMGHTVVGWMWIRLATAAARPAIDAASSDGFYCGKLQTAAYFFRHELPKTTPVAATLLSLDTTVREMRPEWF